MKLLDQTYEFETELFRETAYSRTSLGISKSLMNVWQLDDDDPDLVEVEWIYHVDEPNENALSIGCWFENKKMVDYDGVFELPKEACKVLNLNGYTIPNEFRTYRN